MDADGEPSRDCGIATKELKKLKAHKKLNFPTGLYSEDLWGGTPQNSKNVEESPEIKCPGNEVGNFPGGFCGRMLPRPGTGAVHS